MERTLGYLASSMPSRLALGAGVLLISGLLAATLVRVAPGFGMDERLLDARLTEASREAIERESGGESNVLRYYWNYMRRLSQGDLGVSISLGRPVRELLSERLAVSLRSGAYGLALAWSVSLALAVASALSRRRWGDRAISAATGALLCVPAAIVALGAAYMGAAPAVAVAAILFPRIYRYLRNLLLAARAAPHVLTAHAQGLRSGRLLFYHVAFPILPELLALTGLTASMAVGALIPVEALCDSPGVGQLVWQSALARDLPVLVNVTLLITAVTVAANLLAGWEPAWPRRQV